MPIIVSGTSSTPAPPTVVTSPDGKLTLTTDPDDCGIFLRANFSASSVKPYLVRFERSDGTRVRSGDPAQAPGGVALAYEHEARLSTAWQIRAVPIFRVTPSTGAIGDGTGRTGLQREDDLYYADYGQATEYAAITVADPVGLTDWWLKSTVNPSLSCLLSAKGFATEADQAQFDPIAVPYSPFPAGSFNGYTPQPMELVVAVETITVRRRLRDLCRAGVVLAQPRTGYLDDGDFYALATARSTTPLVAQWQQRRDVTLTLQPVARPATVDAPLIVPGRTITEAQAIAATIGQAAVVWPTIKDAGGFP